MEGCGSLEPGHRRSFNHAVCIGTWPNLHAEVTVAALERGKHVLCEARMACNLTEAKRMLAASEARPQLVAQ